MPGRQRPAARAFVLLGLVLLASTGASADTPSKLRRVVATGDTAPGGGVFDRFGAESMPVVAPVNARDDVAFFSTVARGGSDEGLFLWSRGRITAVAREGDQVPGAGRLSGFGKHPAPDLTDDGTVVFAAAVAGGRAVEGIFAARGARVRPIALSGASVPGIPSGTLAALDAPAINARGDVAFLASVRRGRESFEAVLLSQRGQLKKIVMQGDPGNASRIVRSPRGEVKPFTSFSRRRAGRGRLDTRRQRWYSKAAASATSVPPSRRHPRPPRSPA